MKTTFWRTVAVLLVLAVAPPVFATYESIQHNLIDGQGDTYWNDQTMTFTVQANSDDITLNDPTVLPGTISNGHVYIVTQINALLGPQRARFVGGTFNLTFDYDADGPGSGAPVAYQLAGSNNALEFWVDYTSPELSTIVGEGTWWATTKNLPGSNNWPDGGGLSSIGLLTIGFNTDLSTWQWGDNITADSLETMYTLWPDDRALPEPGSMIMLACGLVGLLVTRRHA